MNLRACSKVALHSIRIAGSGVRFPPGPPDWCIIKRMHKYQEELDKWFKENGWKYWSPLSILARLMEECGEFARLVNHLYGDKPKRSDEKEQELEEEMGDVIYTLICFANSNGIDLDKAIRKSFDKIIKRDRDRWGNEK